MDQGLMAYLDERIEHAVGRFRHLVGGIDVRLTDENGPRGGEALRCRIVVDMRGEGALVVEETRADPFTAVAHAVERIRTGMRRRANRRAHRHRGRE
ncbi:MAG: HPF/RaiA family ribosome-associated protein [Planctomycetota bacterium]